MLSSRECSLRGTSERLGQASFRNTSDRRPSGLVPYAAAVCDSGFSALYVVEGSAGGRAKAGMHGQNISQQSPLDAMYCNILVNMSSEGFRICIYLRRRVPRSEENIDHLRPGTTPTKSLRPTLILAIAALF